MSINADDVKFIVDGVWNLQKLKSQFLKPTQENILVRTFEETSIYMIRDYDGGNKYVKGLADFLKPALQEAVNSGEKVDFPKIKMQQGFSEIINNIKNQKNIVCVNGGQNMAEHAASQMIMSVIMMLGEVKAGQFDFITHTILVNLLSDNLDKIRNKSFKDRAEYLHFHYKIAEQGECFNCDSFKEFYTHNCGSVVMAYVLDQLDYFAFDKFSEINGGPSDKEFRKNCRDELVKYSTLIKDLKIIVRSIDAKGKE